MRNGPNKSEIADINASVLNRSHNRDMYLDYQNAL